MKTYYYNSNITGYTISVEDIDSKVRLVYKEGDIRTIKFLGIPIRKVKVETNLYRPTIKAVSSPFELFLLLDTYTRNQIISIFDFDPEKIVKLTLELFSSAGRISKVFYDETEMYKFLSDHCPNYENFLGVVES